MTLPQQQYAETINDTIVEHMYIVEQETRKILRRGVIHHEYNDLYQLGMIGLIEAAHRFDHQFQCSFSVYARIRVQGSIIDAMRKKDWVPRSVRKRAKEYNEAVQYLTNKFNRPPTKKEICSYINLPLEKLDSHTKLCMITPLISIEERGDNPLPIDDKGICVQEFMIKKEESSQLHTCLRELTQQEQQLIKMYYFEDKSMKAIAQEFGVSESRICQLHGAIKKKLYYRLKRQYCH